MSIEKLVAGTNVNDPTASTGQQVADTANGLVDLAFTSMKSRKARLMLIGDSLTDSGTNPLEPTGLTYTYSSGLSQLSGWVADVQLQPISGTPATGVLSTTGNGFLSFNYNSEGAGSAVDVSGGGFFKIESSSGVYALVKILKKGQPAIARTDTISFGTLKTNLQLGGFNAFAEVLRSRLSINADVFKMGISGDSIVGVASRWLQAYNLCNPDFICVLVGTNDTPANNAAADVMFLAIKAAIEGMLTKVNAVFVGGLFPRADLSQPVYDAMSYYSSLLRDFAAENDRVIYWDAYPYLVTANAVGSSALKTEAFHTDNLHLMPYGACLASKPIISALTSSGAFSGNRSYSRGLVSEQYAINPNPLFLGSGGTGSGSNGVTGTVPQGVTVGRTGGTQALAFSQLTTETQSELRMLVSGSTTANDRHEVNQNFNISSGYYGRKAKMRVRAEIQQADLLNQFEFAVVGASNAFLVYLGQASRVISNVVSGTGFIIESDSEEFVLPSGVATGFLRLRIGTASGGSADIILREFSVFLTE